MPPYLRIGSIPPKRSAKMFGRLDSNHDGLITKAEVDAARTARPAASGKQTGQNQ